MGLNRTKWSLTASTALAAALSTTSAFAEEPQQASTAGQIEELIVTAQRREENVQTVPIAITAIQGQAMSKAGIISTVGLEQLVAGVRMVHKTSGGDEGHAYLRGLGFSSGSPGIDLPVAFYVDDVYVADPVGGSPSFNSIERVEVLKGPQGTLFGRNAVGGVINVHTKDPQAAPESDLELGYGNYDTVTARAYLTGGLTDNLSANLALAYRNQDDGFGYNHTVGKEWRKSNSFSARSKLKLELKDSTTLLLTGWYSEAEGDASSYRLLPGTTAVGPFPAPGGNLYDGYASSQPTKSDASGANLRIDHSFDNFNIVNISSYSHYSPEYSVDLDGTPAPISFVHQSWRSNNYQNEFQINSKSSSHVQWVTGLYFYRQDLIENTEVSGSATPAGQLIAARMKSTAVAPFGQVIVPVLPDTRLTLGLRYNSDQRELDSVVTNKAGARLITAAPSASFDKLTYRVALDHQFSGPVLGYVSLSRGYKPGTFNPGGNPTRPVVQPEILDAYEVGAKSRLLSNSLQLNVAAFYYDYKNLTLRGVLPGGTTTDFFNATNATVYGGEAEAILKPIRDLTISAGLSYLHGRYDTFKSAVSYVQAPPQVGGNIAIQPFDASGYRMANAPELSGNLNVSYSYTPSEAFGTLTASVNAYATSRVYFEPNNVVSQPAYALFNGSILWASPDGLGVRLWMSNITDKKYYGEGSITPLETVVIPGEPRTFGITISKHFN
jgi:iron complex outermembrane receptor protein